MKLETLEKLINKDKALVRTINIKNKDPLEFLICSNLRKFRFKKPKMKDSIKSLSKTFYLLNLNNQTRSE